jgi:hypothetical protein
MEIKFTYVTENTWGKGSGPEGLLVSLAAAAEGRRVSRLRVKFHKSCGSYLLG